MDDQDDTPKCQFLLFHVHLTNPEQVEPSSGPSRVATKKYRDNYDAIFGAPKNKNKQKYVN